jgi:glycerol-3-phosphate dehydrogenase (NAD(P)+)
VHPTLRYPIPGVVPYSHHELGAAMAGSDVVALGVSSAGIDWACAQLKPHARPDLPLFMITKGLRWDGSALHVLPDVVARATGVRAPAAVAGPCIAGELARRVPSCVMLAGRDRGVLDAIVDLLRTDYYHVWSTTDVVGTEVCAALKNAYAMGVAFGTGMHERAGGQPGPIGMHNYESAVFAQAIVEMQRIVVAMGGDASSAAGLAGAGDLDVTNNGGRTGRFGRLLGSGLSVAEAVEAMQGATLECLEIIAVLRQATSALEARGALGKGALPLLDHMAEVVLDGAPIEMPFARFFGAAG